MKSINTELKKVASFLQEALIKDNYKMAREPAEGDEEGGIRAVTPKVVIGALPHSNFMLYDDDRMYQAPYVLVGYDEAEYDYNGQIIHILIQACAYTQEDYGQEIEGEKFPDNMGMLDVNALLQWIMDKLWNSSRLNITKPFKIGTYSTKAVTYPYAFGYLAFDMEQEGELNRTQLLHREMLRNDRAAK